MKKIISLLLSIAMMFSIGAEIFATYEGDKSRTYESECCSIIYSIVNEWTGNQTINMSITNNGYETLRNWAINMDSSGSITNAWNAQIMKNENGSCIIRNNKYNYEIIPSGTVDFGFMLQGDNLSLPENISLCSKTVDSTEKAEIAFAVQNNWGNGFIAAITITNITDQPLEAWKLNFSSNFEISSIWNANKLTSSEAGVYSVENDITTTPIGVGETKTFSFEGAINAGETPEIADVTLTSIVIGESSISGEESGETEEPSTSETEEPTTGETGDTSTDESEEPVEPSRPATPLRK